MVMSVDVNAYKRDLKNPDEYTISWSRLQTVQRLRMSIVKVMRNILEVCYTELW